MASREVTAVLVRLAQRYAFGDLAALLAERAGEALTSPGGHRPAPAGLVRQPGPTGRPGADHQHAMPASHQAVAATDVDTQIRELCVFGQGLFDLDAEDLNSLASTAVPDRLLRRALACRMPQAPTERHRGALGTLRPMYRLLLEVIAARWHRRETAALVAAVHITGVYAPLLVWEQVLGHAGDPARLPSLVGREGSAWGDVTDPQCPHSPREKDAAQASMRVAWETPPAWRSYLDGQHGHVAHALGVCAIRCTRPCPVLTSLSAKDTDRLITGCQLAMAYVDSPIVQLHTRAPVGQGFGVPSANEVLDAWALSRQALSTIDPAVVADDGFVLPGLTRFLSVLTGARAESTVGLTPDTLLADTAATIRGLLFSSERAGIR